MAKAQLKMYNTVHNTSLFQHVDETDIEFRSGKHYKNFTLRIGESTRDEVTWNVLVNKLVLIGCLPI